MTSTIKIKNSSTAGAVPGSGDLVQGELAVNVTDKKIYTKNASGTIVNLGTTPSITDNGNAEAIVIDSSENIGLGVSPSAWGGSFKALEFGGGNSFYSAGDRAALSANAYYNGSAWTYKANGAANRYEQTGGSHYWYYAGSGTAGSSISFTQAMTLDSSGNLAIGVTSAATNVHIAGSSGITLGAVAGNTWRTAAIAPIDELGTYKGALAFYTHPSAGSPGAPTERARIDSSGNLLVGTTSGSSKLTVSGTVSASGSVSFTQSYNDTTASAANMNIQGDGYLRRSTSALKYKKDIRDLENIDINLLRPVRYKSKCEMDDQTIDHFGIVADEVHDAGLTELVNYGETGEVEGFQYERLTVVLLKKLQVQQEIIEQLQADVAALKG